MIPTNRQPTILGYQNITFEGTIFILCSTNITCDCNFVRFGSSLIFFHIWWYRPHIMQYRYHMWLYFCHIRWFHYFFLKFDGTILTLCSTNITCDCTFITFSGSLIFFLTFDGSIVILSSTNVTYDRTFLTFSDTLIFSSHLTVSLSHWAVLTSHMTVLLSHSVVHLFFLTCDGSIVTLGNTNILFDHNFLTFGGTLIFTHIWQFHHYIEIWATSYVTILLSHLIVLFFPPLTFDSSIITLSSTNITYDNTFATFGCTCIFFFLTFDGTIFKLCSIKITCDCTFVTFGGSIFFPCKW